MLIQRIRIIMMIKYKIELSASWKPNQKGTCGGWASSDTFFQFCLCPHHPQKSLALPTWACPTSSSQPFSREFCFLCLLPQSIQYVCMRLNLTVNMLKVHSHEVFLDQGEPQPGLPAKCYMYQ